MLEREYGNNQKAYLLKKDVNELIAFVMTGIHRFDDLEINYLGLACVKEAYKNNVIIMQLFIKGIEDAIYFNSQKMLAHNSFHPIFRMVHCIFNLVSPSRNFQNFLQLL